jgi:hypothetical protein
MTEKADAAGAPDNQLRNLLDSGPAPLAWYEPETYEDIKAPMIDGRAFASSHEKWEGHAKQVEASFIAKGVPTVRVPVDPRDFGRWCVSRNRAPDAKERLAFSQWATHSRAVANPGA